MSSGGARSSMYCIGREVGSTTGVIKASSVIVVFSDRWLGAAWKSLRVKLEGMALD